MRRAWFKIGWVFGLALTACSLACDASYSAEITHIRIGTTNFMVSEANGESLKAMPATYYIYVENVDRALDRALSNGAKKMFDPMDMPYGDRQAGITDPVGNIWWISNRLVNKAYD